MKFDLTQLIEAIITLVTAVMTCFLIPMLKQRLSESKQETLKYWTETAVTAAEQLYGSKAGQQKKEYVLSFLLSKGIVVDVDEVTALIESTVYSLTGKKAQENK
ncbi:MAG: phage holin, LLH family [Acutalibacteraceae bacterium]